MPIEVAIWRLGKKLEKINFSSIESEVKVEDSLAEDLSLLSPDLMMIGRQVPTALIGATDHILTIRNRIRLPVRP